MLTHFSEEHGKSGCREGRRHGGHHGEHKGGHHGGHNGGHGCDSDQYRLRPEFQIIWDCLTFCIPKPIKSSCLIPRNQINKFIGEMMQ